ncbi:MAG: TorF family putative porin [Burkholderiaceae bacterium]
MCRSRASTSTGISQTNRKPALQGGFDYAHASGFYLGTWGSSISWLSDGAANVSSGVELDFYGGYKAKAGPIEFDVGLLQYYYPGTYPAGFTSPDTLEIYAAGSWQMLTLKYSHSLTNLFGFTDSKGSGYIDLSAAFPVGQFTLKAHVGHQTVPATTGRAKSDFSYSDWSVGVATQYAGIDFGLSYIDTNAKTAFFTNAFGKDTGKGTVVLTVGKAF